MEAKKTSFNKWLASKEVEDKIECKRNTALAKRHVRRHGASWDKFGTNLNMRHTGLNLKCTKILKSISKDIGNNQNSGTHR
jgi:hypothetical protein